jgi:hypothetical protein
MLQIAQRSLQVPGISVCGSSHTDAEPRVTCSDIGDWEHPRGMPFTNAPTCRVRLAFVRAPRPPTPPQKWPHDELRRRILDPSHWIKKSLSRRRLKGDRARHESENGRHNRHGFHLIGRALGAKRRPLGSTLASTRSLASP